MAITSHFAELSSIDAKTPTGIWGWAKRLIDALNRWKLFNLMDVPITDKPYYVIRVAADGSEFELVPEELGLAGQDLTGLANRVVRVKPTEDGFFIDKEVMASLLGVSLAGKAGKAVIVNSTEDGYTIAP